MNIDLTEAVELKSGGLYALQVGEFLTREVIEKIRLRLAPYEESHGVKFLLLSKSVNLVQAAKLRDAVKTILGEERNA